MTQLRARLADAEKRAAVLIPLVARDEVSVLLTRRAAHLNMHAGQVSFPGGRIEAEDADAEAAALRETHEEVGIPSAKVEVVGCLPDMPTLTGYAVSPMVGLLPADIEVVVDRSEVDYAFEVPLGYFLDPANDVEVPRTIEKRLVTTVEFHWQEERIWGATAYMLVVLRDFLRKQ